MRCSFQTEERDLCCLDFPGSEKDHDAETLAGIKNDLDDELREQRRILKERLEILGKRNRTTGSDERRVHDQPLSEEDRLILIRIAEAVERYKRNPFDDLDAVVSETEMLEMDASTKDMKVEGGSSALRNESHNDSDLREKEGSEDEEIKEEGFIQEHGGSDKKLKEKEVHHDAEEETDEHPNHSRGVAEKYCDEYEQHFSFYCVGETDRIGQNVEEVSKFCPSYKSACSHKQITTSLSLTTWPTNPFTKAVSFRAPAISKEGSDESEEELTSEEEEPERKEQYYRELKRRFPCKPDCDKRIFPHCTDECKCDYIYPVVQRFCNPPPLPLFLNTCRLWYNGCPKYAQYHYASQYIYSKAEKGKKVPGPLTNNPNPYNIPSPAGFPPVAPTSRLAGQITREQQYSNNPQSLRPLARSSNTLVAPPPLPHSVARERESMTGSRKTAVNSLTAEPVKTIKDPASFLSGSGASDHIESYSSEGSLSRPRAHQANTFPVVPSDAIYGTDDNTFKKFDALTDSSGVLHRPRSRSPFSKPGLWEPNPDNPHNRDHANKFFYYPRSVSADWLNGQVAWGAHWAVPAAGVGGTDGFSTLHFPTVGTFLNIPDDYD
ncbi:hypothetical protein RB195_010589 [Necator americanus]|uniref:Uncharacterized protein n=1 Tax=Necator americanus TaxID=51031 RepID=A0ABR1CYR2_NECAM